MGLMFLALVPALAVLTYYRQRDKRPEPWHWVGFVFFLGMLSCLLAFPLERWAQSLLPAPTRPDVWLLLECLLIPGLIEESVKLTVVAAAVLWRDDFDEPVDGLVYAAAGALGFTCGEDFYYYLVHGFDWSRVMTTASHPWFSCFWGVSLGWARELPWRRGLALVALGLLASSAVHALFDFLILAADMPDGHTWLRFFLTPLLIGLFLTMEWHIDRAQLE